MNPEFLKKFGEKGVFYYNKDNKENKDNKDNTKNLTGRLSLDRATPLEATPLPDQRDTTSMAPSQEVAKPEIVLNTQSETPPRMGMANPAILPEEVDRCLLTFYDNGEQARQRYKLNITINPNTAPNERWEFTANLNKDRRIFMRNIPEENAQFVRDFGNLMRERTKAQYQCYPMLGKIHSNSKRANAINQKEDGCAAAVYWTGAEWRATVMLWEYLLNDVPLTDSLVTKAQKNSNVKCVSGVIYGPHSKSQAQWRERARPTFKSRRQGGPNDH